MFLLLLLSWLPQAVWVTSVPPAPVRAHLKSSNMRHMLQWERGASTAAEVTYSVSFHKDREMCCSVVPGCERLVEDLVCNLTKALSNPEETYHVRVTAQLGSEQSSSNWLQLFPRKDTKLQLPILKLVHCGSSLCVDMDAPVAALHSIYNSFFYKLKVQRDSEEPMVEGHWSLQRYVVPEVKVGSQYCVSLRFSDDVVPRQSSFSPPQCVHIHSRVSAERPLAAIALLLVTLLLVFLALVYSGCICLRGPVLPSALISVHPLEARLMVFFDPLVESWSLPKPATLSYGQGEHCGSESDYSEDESDKAARQGDSYTAPYTRKGSLCSALSLNSSHLHSSEPRKESAEQERTEEARKESAEQERTEEARKESAEQERTEEARKERAEQERTEEARKERAEQDERMQRAGEGRTDGAEEVNLLTLTFSRDTDLEWDSGVDVPETQLPVWAVAEPDEDCEEEGSQSGYMRR